MALVEPELRKATDAMLDTVQAGPGARLLDLACGPGHTTAAAQLRGASALGLDITPAMVAAARSRFPDSHFEVGDMLAPPPGPWDAITCRFGAHHADAAWFQAAWRVLKPGGRIAIAELGPTNDESRENGMQEPSAWVRLLQDAGFGAVAVTTLTLDLHPLAASDPELATMLHEGPFQGGRVFIISGCKPGQTNAAAHADA